MSNIDKITYEILNSILNENYANLISNFKNIIRENKKIQLTFFNDKKGTERINVEGVHANKLIALIKSKKVIVFNNESLNSNEYNYANSSCIYFDTNICSYIRNIYMKGCDSDNLEVFNTVNNLMKKNIHDFSIKPYFKENILKVKLGHLKKEVFKETYVINQLLLDWNFSGLSKFREEGRDILGSNNKTIKLKCTEFDNLYDKYTENIEDEEMIYYGIYAIFLKGILINNESRKNADKKMVKLIEFIDEEIGVLFKRPCSILYWYFKRDPKIMLYFKKIQKGRDNIPDIKGMVWDIYHIEKLYIYYDKPIESIVEYKYFLTNDKGLIDIMDKFDIRFILENLETKEKRIEYIDAFNNGDITNEVVEKLNVEKRRLTYNRMTSLKLNEIVKKLEEEILEMMGK